MRFRRASSLASVALLVASARVARAQSTTPADGAVRVVIEEPPPSLGRAQIRRAIARELRARVIEAEGSSDIAGAVLVVSFDDGTLREVFRDANGREIDRTVAAPRSERELLRTVAWLAGNLARHEAEDVLASLPAREPPVAIAADPNPPSTPVAPSLPTGRPVASSAPSAAASPPGPQQAAPRPLAREVTPFRFRVLASLFPPVSTDGLAMGTLDHSIGVSVLASTARTLTGLDIAGAFTFTHDDAFGLQLAGLSNVVGCRVRGVQLASVANVAGCDAQGMQLAAFNVARHDVAGVQLAGIANISGGNAIGFQLAGGLDLVRGTARGVQWAGIANVASHLEGWQLGFANVGRDRVSGIQTGVVNYAGSLHGVQIGAVNIVGRGNGVSLGIVTVAPGQPAHFEVTGGSLPAFGIALRHGTRYLRNVYSFSVAPFSQETVWMPGWGIGAHIPGERVEFDIDAIAHWIQRGASFSLQPNILTQLRVTSTIVIAPRFGVMLGAALNWMYTVDAANVDLVLGPRAVVNPTASEQHVVWPSLHLGIRL